MLADLRSWIRREFWRAAGPRLVPERDAQALLKRARDSDESDATLSAMERFAELMLQEVQARSQILDTKALSILGWTSAAAALFLSRAPRAGTFETWQVVLLSIGGASALLAVSCAFLAIRVRKFKWPSQADWFCEGEAASASRLRSYYLLAALDTHTAHTRENRRKAHYVHLSQWGLGLTAICLTLGLLTGVLISAL